MLERQPAKLQRHTAAPCFHSQCNATVIGGWKQACMSCRADDPTICLKVRLDDSKCMALLFSWVHTANLWRHLPTHYIQCEGRCGIIECDGYFVTQEGHCSMCPEGAAACDDLTGKVTACRHLLGLVGGECRPCKGKRCETCDGEQMP